MINDDERALLVQVSGRHPGALRVCMELRYKERSPDVWEKLVELGITGLDLWQLYMACGYHSHATLVALSDGTATAILRANPESRFYQPAGTKEDGDD